MKTKSVLLLMVTLTGACGEDDDDKVINDLLRVATYNILDTRQPDLENPDQPRLKKIAQVLQTLRPDIVLINEIAYDMPGAPGFQAGATPGQNGQRFADAFLAVSQGEGFEPLRYTAYMAPSNTGVASGFDFDNQNSVVTTYPIPPGTKPDGKPGDQSPEGRQYGNDSYGFGTFPGQYAMALLVREGFSIQFDQIRTFQNFLWKDMPNALQPTALDGSNWYTAAEWNVFRLSSKSHWDIPVRTPNGRVVHVLASHPTPPAFDGDEQRNKKRNHDEIRFFGDYISGAQYIYDDQGRTGGLAPGVPFVVVGDQNADPTRGSSINNPMGTFLLDNPRVAGDFVPLAAGLPADQASITADFGLRVDYAQPSTDFEILGGEVYRGPGSEASDHFPVFVDLKLAP